MDFQNKKQKGLHSNFQILLDLKQGFFHGLLIFGY